MELVHLLIPLLLILVLAGSLPNAARLLSSRKQRSTRFDSCNTGFEP